MIQRIELTYEEKYAMYDMLSKEELIAMLIESNRVLEMFANNPTVIGIGQTDSLVQYRTVIGEDAFITYKSNL